MAAGSISAQQFSDCLEIFMQQCLLSHDRWEMKTSVNGEKYLCKRQCVASRKETTPLGDDAEDPSLEEQLIPISLFMEMEADPASVVVDCRTITFTYEYHVVYSHSYAVPVLYFNAYKTDGKLLSLEEIWSNVPNHYRERLNHERWTFLTQQEHPLVGRPFYQLHPCHTADLMKQASAMENTSR
ncbi:ubiquitin-like-conjugating enzyme ATG10 [Liolophura sinensis]|uniref:ubiquitin-like-conjugating enzyme ATG10 n=1 Tax=Liolophura sinensis TaxID=3198878 RepID=UPI0031597FB0